MFDISLLPSTTLVVYLLQSDDPAVQWQLNLYKDVMVKSEEPLNPESTVARVQSISAAVFHLEQVKQLQSSSHMNITGHKDKDTPCIGDLWIHRLQLRFLFLVAQVEQPLRNKKCVWQKLLSKQRKRAVVACFRMAPLYNLPR